MLPSIHGIALRMLFLEVHPFLVHPPPWGKLKLHELELKMHKVGSALKLREKLGLNNMNEIIFIYEFLLSLVISI